MDSQRSARLGAEAARITAWLVEHGATLVVAFGSFARGTVQRRSDLDMIAVMDSELPFIKRLVWIYESIGAEVGLDLLVYTPAEFEEVKHRALIRTALTEERALHAA